VAAGATHVITALPSSTVAQRRRAFELASTTGLPVLTVPSVSELQSGGARIERIRAIEPEDLLGREPVVLDEPGIAELVSGKTVLVTGAGGSIGSELCRQLVRYRPARLVLFDQSEFNLYSIDQELADPFILRQQLDFIRTATISYYNWVAAGYRLQLANQLLEIARNRQTAITEMVARGAQAPIVKIDNERLVISRELALVSARRLLEAHGIELSLFYRDASDQPIRPASNQIPTAFPPVKGPGPEELPNDIAKALMFRPEIRRVELNIEKNAIDQRLARNNLLPNLDLSLEANQAIGTQSQKDIDRTELEARIDLKVPIQRREAKGRLAVTEGQFTQLMRDRQFTRDQITATVQDAHSALQAARDQIKQTDRNVELAEQLEKAESARFDQGAADLLALQIREQATFDARLIQLQAKADFFRALANYRASIAADAPTSLAKPLPQ
jgi:outer membrane protein TolC